MTTETPLYPPPRQTPPTPVLAARTASPPAWPFWRGGMEYGLASRCGSYHAENEDSALCTPQAGLLAVADGVGSGARGKTASQALLRQIKDLTPALLQDPAGLRAWLLAADDAVATEIERHTEKSGATTFVAGVSESGGRRWHLTWAGDCRAYLLDARGALHQQTRDDTYANLGELPPEHATPEDPARMVGNGAVDQPNAGVTRLEGGEILFLCSDGVHRYVPQEQMAKILRAAGSLEQRCRQLVQTAHDQGGTDDATVVAVARHNWLGLSKPLWCLLGAGILALLMALAAWRWLPVTLLQPHLQDTPAPVSQPSADSIPLDSHPVVPSPEPPLVPSQTPEPTTTESESKP